MPPRRQKKQREPFEFAFQGKRYLIRAYYECQQTTLVLTDGIKFKVHQWKLLSPFEPIPHEGTLETFDPQAQEPAALAKEVGGFVAELQPTAEETKPA